MNTATKIKQGIRVMSNLLPKINIKFPECKWVSNAIDTAVGAMTLVVILLLLLIISEDSRGTLWKEWWTDEKPLSEILSKSHPW